MNTKKPILTLDYINWFTNQLKTQCKFMKSKFRNLQVDYYFENDKYYFMYKWYTNA